MTPPTIFIRSILGQTPKALLGWSEIADPMVVGIIARAGYDVVLLDQQHGYHDIASVQASIGEAALAGKPVLVRTPVGDYATAGRLLDFGAAGVVAPMINTAAEAQAFVMQVKYPPIGQRSFGPTRAMQLAQQADAAAFVSDANDQTLAIVMIETGQALDSLDDILAVQGIDGILLGPADLSISLTNGGFAPDGPEVTAALDGILAAVRKHCKFAIAFGGTVERSRYLLDLGFDLVSVGYDTGVLEEAFTALSGAVRSRIGDKMR